MNTKKNKQKSPLLIKYLQQFDSSFSLIEAVESPKVYVAGQISGLHQ
jgi:hypothetical protein